MANTPTGTTTGTTATTSSTKSPLDEFVKGVKHDPSVFTKLHDQKQFNDWNDNVVTWVAAQCVDEVLDPSHKPPFDQEAVFKEKQKCMCAVFNSVLLTDKGKTIVHKYTADKDAQAVYRDFVDHATESTRAKITAASTLSYLILDNVQAWGETVAWDVREFHSTLD